MPAFRKLYRRNQRRKWRRHLNSCLKTCRLCRCCTQIIAWFAEHVNRFHKMFCVFKNEIFMTAESGAMEEKTR